MLTTLELWIIIIGMTVPFLATALGAAAVFLFRGQISDKVNSILLGFAAGVMIAASVWSLIIPSLEFATASGWGKLAIIPVAVGFVLGVLFLWLIDHLVPHMHHRSKDEEGLPAKKMSNDVKLFLAMTIHNFPEGIAVGFAFAVAYAGITNPDSVSISLFSALALSIGMAIQNIPEGAAVSLPMARRLESKGKAFGFGVASAIVEPIGAILAFLFATVFQALLPWFLSFAAGAMMFVVVEDLIPEANLSGTEHQGTFAVMLGFVLMMSLDIVLG
jgi:ZIP family zinc transporter